MDKITWGSWEDDVEDYSNPERTLLLVGRTGNGKSATGNSILGETKFLSKARGRFITKECQLYESKVLKVNVIDTPDLFSASSTTEFTVREIVRCLRLAQNGIDAVLLVFSVRNRLTEEELTTFRTLKTLFGCEIVEYTIAVFTDGDALDDDGETLDDYLEDCPEFEEILNECDGRKVLFDNRSNIPESKKDKQVQDLLNLVEQISKKNGKPLMSDLSMKNLMLQGIEEKIANQQKESSSVVKEKLAKAEAAREETEKKMAEAQKLSSEEISRLREQLNLLKESLGDVKEKLAKAQGAKEETEKKMAEVEKLSSDEIRRLREQLNKAERETNDDDCGNDDDGCGDNDGDDSVDNNNDNGDGGGDNDSDDDGSDDQLGRSQIVFGPFHWRRGLKIAM